MAIYRPLDDSIHEIRVLHILSEGPPQPYGRSNQTPCRIECLLEYISLDDSPSYHALSYTWQLPESDVPFSDREPVEYNSDGGVDILLDGHVVSVTFNLWAALKHFQSLLSLDEESEMFPKETRLWVDAVCINQQDLSERSAQVRQMRQIYQKAQSVDVWLGPEANNSSLAFEFANKYMSYLESFNPKYPSRKRDKIKHLMNRLLRRTLVLATRPRPMIEEFIMVTLEDQDCRPSWVALTAVYERSYWRRIWIVQEILSNQHTYVYCGRSSMVLTGLLGVGDMFGEVAMKNLDKFVTVRGEDGSELFRLSASLVALEGLLEDRERYRNPDFPGNELDFLLHSYAGHLSSDPRDMIYALLGLSNQYPQERLEIDYSLPVSVVFKAAARYIIEGSKSLEILRQAGSRKWSCSEGTHQPSTEFPSWIPDWRCRSSPTFGVFHQDINPYQYLGLSAGYPAAFSSNGSVITCSGFEVGIIGNVCHLDDYSERTDWNHVVLRPRKLVNFVLSAEGLLEPNMTLEVERSGKSAELYKTLCLTYDFYDMVQSALSERQFEHICQEILLPNEGRPFNPGLAPETLTKQLQILDHCCRGRTWFSTVVRTKHPTPSMRTVMGMCAPTARLNDKIVVLRECSAPILLRERPDALGTYTFIEEVYLHTFMHGEGVGKFEEQSFEIH